MLLTELLVDAGYSREDPVDEHGEFCVRGGVVDFFPAGDTHPYRLEFVGDTIESIRRYDPASQRSVETVDLCTVFPLREAFPGAGATNEDEKLDRSASIVDYLVNPRRIKVFVSEWDDVKRHIVERQESIESSYADAVKRGERVVAEPAALIASWDILEPVLSKATHLEQLEIGGDDGPDRLTAARSPRAGAERRRRRRGGSRGRRDHAARRTRRRCRGCLRGERPAPAPAPRAPRAGMVHIACQPVRQFHGRIPDWVSDLRRARDEHETVLFVAATSGRAERTIELLKEYDLIALPIEHTETTRGAALLVATGSLSAGFRLPAANLRLFAETDIFDEERVGRERRQSATRTFLSDFRDLKVGDLIVHVDHGIGVFVGLKKITVGVDVQEFMELRYSGEDKLFVPVERLDLVQKYSGGARPSLDRLGGTTWEKAKTRVKKAMRDMAGELLKLYAARKAVPGFAFSPDTHWQEEFENAFEWDLTPDQTTAITDIKRDMESPSPMDRLLCGDVGYGKTEVAMRAAFKSVMDGRQVAVLAPTTVLALQHLKTLRSRFAAFPVKIDMVSSFRSKQEQKETLDQLTEGKLDIIVGTHRLLSKDVIFKDLGLLVVDEEQRFGVAHKERIKQMRRKIDVLTMSATPIPRTLNMSLIGIRDMSIIETPPRDRLAIQTNVVKFDQKVITPRDPPGDGARRADLLRAQPRRVDLFDGRAAAAAGAGSADHHRPRADGRWRARKGDGQLHRAQVGRAARDDDHRERARHPQREHDDHQPRRSLRPRAALSAPRPRRPVRQARVRVSAGAADRIRCRRSRGSGSRRFASSATWAAASAWRRSTSKSAAPGTCSAASRAATSRPSASRCT